MGKHYGQLAEQDRTFLQIMLDKGYSKIKIATILGVHRSTIHGVIRVELKRDHEIDKLKQHEINRIITNINNRPFKCLGYLTPEEIFKNEIQKYKSL